MTDADQRDPADVIRAQARALSETDGWQAQTEHIDVLASLAEGTTRLSDLDDRRFERLVDVHGLEVVLDAAATGAKLTGVRRSLAVTPDVSAAASRWTWRRPAYALAAAALVVLAIWLVSPAGRGSNTGSEPPQALATAALVVQWPTQVPEEWRRQVAWPPNVPVGEPPPDFTRPVGLLGGSTDAPTRENQLRARAARAAVVVRAGSVWGNGVLFSPDGWALTSYRVVEAVAQQAAIRGQPARVDVAMLSDDGARGTGQGSLRQWVGAVLYRADPLRDLALLKLDARAPALAPFVPFGDEARVGAESFLIATNSQEAWHEYGARIGRAFTYAGDASPSSSTQDPDRDAFSRWRTRLVATDALLTNGDLGAPLFDDAGGTIVGLTVRPRVRQGSGYEAWHVPVDELRTFVIDLPTAPEGVPFDPWTAGRPDLATLEPALLDGDRDGRLDTLRYGYADARRGTTVAPQAVTMFVDLEQRSNGSEPEARVPQGLWGVAGGGFRFDAFVVVRADGIAASGFVNGEGILDEIRTGRTGSGTAITIWQRTQAGRWHAQEAKAGLPLIDFSRFADPTRGVRLRALIEGGLRPPVSGQKP